MEKWTYSSRYFGCCGRWEKKLQISKIKDQNEEH